MYHAKASNTSHYKLFDESMRSKVLFAMQLEMDLRVALEQKQFVLHYQPIISLKQRKIVRFEALVRWQHPLRGYVYPLDFITNAEETGMIVEIDRWVLGQVCKDIKAWNERKLPKSQFSINFSAKQFEQRGLIKQIKEILSEHNIEPGYLGIEITESVAMNDVSLSIAVLNQLREMGINISIDDFGMGYSSLNSLKLFPVDHLKIDRHFITDVPQDHERGAIIEAIIVMAHKLGYKVVGEGVETRNQLDFLCKNKCDEGQGYLFSKPIDFNRLEDLLLQPDFKTDFTKKD
jgi:EAL domain-containing protein (putative c-di-GMP-specific phosphodiesterase class I)